MSEAMWYFRLVLSGALAGLALGMAIMLIKDWRR
jgi:hypothetical protein